MDLEPTLSHAIADGWAEFTERVLPAIQDAEHAEARVAFYFGALYVLQLAQQVIADRSSEAVSLALDMLSAELEQFVRSHAIAIQ